MHVVMYMQLNGKENCYVYWVRSEIRASAQPLRTEDALVKGEASPVLASYRFSLDGKHLRVF